MSENFDFVEFIYSGGLAKKADTYGVSSLSDVQKNVMLTWWAKGEIDNGGFELLYSSPVNIDEVISAFISVDANSYAKACMDSKALFPNKNPPIEVTQRNELIDLISSSDDEPWLSFNKIIWANSDDFDGKVTRYIKTNIEHFREWL